MKTSSLALIFFLLCSGASAQENPPQDNYLGLNALHSVLIAGLSSAGGNPILPLQINYARVLDGHWGLAGHVIFQSEPVGVGHTGEFGAAAGPAYFSDGLEGFFVDFRLGIAYAFGTDFYSRAYTRLDLILEPDAGMMVDLGPCTLQIGAGFLSLPMLTETPSRKGKSPLFTDSWDWGALGAIAHSFLPVLNTSVGFRF